MISGVALLSVAKAVPAQAQTPGYQIDKVVFEFHNVLKVGFTGSVSDSKDPAQKGMAVPFTISLHYQGIAQREVQRAFQTRGEWVAWIENELCKEIQDVKMTPLREQQSQAESAVMTRLKPQLVNVSGVRTESRPESFDEMVVCPR